MPFRTVTVSPKMIPAQDVGLQAALMGPLKMTEVSSLGFFYLFLEQHVEEENKPKAACSQLFGDYIGRL